jgi:hypothetical protein
VGAAEILARNRPTLNPGSALFLAALWIAAGALLGALVARPFRVRPPATGPALAAIAAGGCFLPPLPGATFAAGIPLLLLARRRFLERHGRLDALLIAVVTASAAVLLFARAEEIRLFSPPAPPERLPKPGPKPFDAVPVVLSLRDGGDFPEVPAVHVPLRPLASEAPGRLAALRTGRAPARTPVGVSIPRLLPGGGGVSRFPKGASRFLLAAFPHGTDGIAPFARRATLEDRVAAAGIPVLHGAPQSDDPPLFLRIVEDRTLDREMVEALRRRGAWIDVRLGPEGGRVALTGRGVRLAPVNARAAPMDVVPTALHLLGVPVPRSSDGRVLVELLDPAGAGGRPIRYSPRKVPGTHRATISSRKSASLRTASNLGSLRNRSGEGRS